MKTLVTVFFALTSFATQAMELSARHQSLINKAIEEKCLIRPSLKLESVKVVEDRIDQGVIDYYFTTNYTAMVRIDQGVFDFYDVVVKSAEFSAYDHQAQDWGIIEIQSVTCKIQ
jgi:hypothetical protein